MLQELITSVNENRYIEYLNQKTNAMQDRLNTLGVNIPRPDIYQSPASHYRMRSEFSIFHGKKSFDYIMFQRNGSDKEKIVIENFKVHAAVIDKVMTPLKRFICSSPSLKNKLFEIDFLSNLSNEMIIALNYHKILDEIFHQELRELKAKLNTAGFKADVIARAKKQLIMADKNSLIETYCIQDGSEIKLKQVEGTFTQPNAATCAAMIGFARECARSIKCTDLLELYCGSGTFTVALAPFFNKVLATEVARIPTQTALENLKLNGINNTKLVRLSALEVGQALNQVRAFRRLEMQDIELNAYNFNTLFIDPPRSGLCDKESLDFTAQFDHVIYISCGMESFVEDLKALCQTHEIKKLAFFDQFPYTKHLESGALLIKKQVFKPAF